MEYIYQLSMIWVQKYICRKPDSGRGRYGFFGWHFDLWENAPVLWLMLFLLRKLGICRRIKPSISSSPCENKLGIRQSKLSAGRGRDQSHKFVSLLVLVWYNARQLYRASHFLFYTHCWLQFLSKSHFGMMYLVTRYISCFCWPSHHQPISSSVLHWRPLKVQCSHFKTMEFSIHVLTDPSACQGDAKIYISWLIWSQDLCF